MVGDPKTDLDLFLARYGSHYVSAIKYGLRIGIQAKLKKEKTSDSTALSVDFKAAFGSVSAEAGIRKEHSKKLENKGVEILFEATSGGRLDKGLVTARGFDEINELLDGIRNGDIQFSVAPIQVILKPYWPTLRREWKNLRIVLEPNDQNTTVPAADYGVPKGTIIPWYPSGEYLEGLEDKSKTVNILPPDGWALCDGKGGTPNLCENFIFGTDKFSNIGQSGGAVNHSHGGKTDIPSGTIRIPKGGHGHRMPVENHTHNINDDSHLPPFIMVGVYYENVNACMDPTN